jgi:zinc resistance-associated protein
VYINNPIEEETGMKKIWMVGLLAAVGLVLLGGGVYTAWGQGYGPCGGGYGYGTAGKQVDANALRAFQKETLPLRDEMMAKRIEIRNEYAKEKPDQNRVAGLEKDMIDLRTKIRAAAEKQGLPAQGFGPGMGGRGYGYGPKMMGSGNAGPGRGGRGAGRGNCPMWQ